MPEGGRSNVEIAHEIHERGQEHEQEQHQKRVDLAVEIAEALLLALVAIATAWSGYQSALWDGESAKLYGTSSRIRFEATANDTRGGQQQLYDATTFNFWLQPKLTGDEKLAADYEKRFRPEYRPAFRAWLALDPFHNPRAPPGPIFMPQYHNALLDRSVQQDNHASATFERAVHARETGDKYVRTTVLLATVLFLIAVSQRFGLFKVRVGILVVALVLLVLALNNILTYDRL
jgi:hypothetical protein